MVVLWWVHPCAHTAVTCGATWWQIQEAACRQPRDLVSVTMWVTWPALRTIRQNLYTSFSPDWVGSFCPSLFWQYFSVYIVIFTADWFCCCGCCIRVKVDRGRSSPRQPGPARNPNGSHTDYTASCHLQMDSWTKTTRHFPKGNAI